MTAIPSIIYDNEIEEIARQFHIGPCAIHCTCRLRKLFCVERLCSILAQSVNWLGIFYVFVSNSSLLMTITPIYHFYGLLLFNNNANNLAQVPTLSLSHSRRNRAIVAFGFSRKASISMHRYTNVYRYIVRLKQNEEETATKNRNKFYV